MSCIGTRLIYPACHIAHGMQAIFASPVRAVQHKPLARTGSFR